MFVTVWLGILDITTGKIRCANAGHEYPALRRAGGKFEQLSGSVGTPFTTARPVDLHQESITFGPGDEFFACSNGVFSYKDREGQLFTKKMLLSSLNATKADSAEVLIEDVTSFIRGFSGEIPPEDDVIMAAFRMNS
jgi:sigma-B regulation protein RsbU (phosphoserine phosphatase)